MLTSGTGQQLVSTSTSQQAYVYLVHTLRSEVRVVFDASLQYLCVGATPPMFIAFKLYPGTCHFKKSCVQQLGCNT
jgi:hypothetical protein